ncbi:MAG: hypothetical protein AAB757_02580 [Patescibacteria group bacterium]
MKTKKGSAAEKEGVIYKPNPSVEMNIVAETDWKKTFDNPPVHDKPHDY